MTRKTNVTGAAHLRGVEWPTVTLIAACYASWLAAGLFLWPAQPVVALAVLTLSVSLHSSLCHEVLHGHPTRSARLNELLVFLPIGVLWPYRRFKTLHLMHHADERLTDPFDDPESYYRALWKLEAMPRPVRIMLALNNTMAGRLVLGPVLGFAGLVAGDLRALREGNRQIRDAWAMHLAGLVPTLLAVQFLFGVPLWLYVLVPVWAGHSIIAIRTYAEHQWSERPEGRTIIVERSPLSFFFLNNNLHLVHHKLPTAAWYRLPGLFRARRAEWMAMNGGYVFPNYWSLIKTYAFRAKEPVAHPVLRRMPEPGRAFRPRMRARNVGGLGTMPVPAQPPKE